MKCDEAADPDDANHHRARYDAVTGQEFDDRHNGGCVYIQGSLIVFHPGLGFGTPRGFLSSSSEGLPDSLAGNVYSNSYPSRAQDAKRSFEQGGKPVGHIS